MLGCHGLQNLGNSCYLNALLQALASCTQFRDCLLEHACDGPYTRKMRHCLLQLRAAGPAHTVDANKALWRHLQRGGLLSHDEEGAQQDAEEIFGLLCGAMINEAAQGHTLSTPTTGAQPDTGAGMLSILDARRGAAYQASQRRGAAVEQQLQGLEASGYSCTECGWHSDISVTSYLTIKLNIADIRWRGSPGKSVPLETLLQRTVAPEFVEGVPCPYCSGKHALAALKADQDQLQMPMRTEAEQDAILRAAHLGSRHRIERWIRSMVCRDVPLMAHVPILKRDRANCRRQATP